ncbi:MAG: ATP-binding cassette domain-containing protein [Maribacter sp.]|nr:ATP-binding cassette domain-containing protein [Maribacter sp.]
MILEVDNIELSFGNKRILYGIYIKAETGQVTGILGRNGSGKTCMLRIIFGDLDPKYKSIRKNGIHQEYGLFKNRDIAFLPQHQLLPKNIKLSKAFDIFNLDWNVFTNIFNAFKIHEQARTTELSSGELRVVETYLVLCSGKNIILLDEPFSFIAPIYIEKFKELIREKKRESIIIVTDHFYREIMQISDSVYLLKNGYSKLIETKEQLKNEGYISLNPQQK